LDAKFTDFKLAPCYVGETDPDANGICDHSGSTLPYAPDFSATLSVNMDTPITDSLAFFGGISLSYSDSYFTEGTLDPAASQDSYSKLDANFGIRDVDDKWDISVIARNLDDEYVLNITQPGSFGGYIGYGSRPRTITLQGRYRF
jgi:iron complex outermembrane receptor protein